MKGASTTASVVITRTASPSHNRPIDYALGTKWGLFRHYWVLITLALTILATVVLLLHMPDVSSLADVAREADGADLGGLGGDLFHAGGGLLVLLVITVLNVYKPRGMTPYGQRKQHEERATSQP